MSLVDLKNQALEVYAEYVRANKAWDTIRQDFEFETKHVVEEFVAQLPVKVEFSVNFNGGSKTPNWKPDIRFMFIAADDAIWKPSIDGTWIKVPLASTPDGAVSLSEEVASNEGPITILDFNTSITRLKEVTGLDVSVSRELFGNGNYFGEAGIKRLDGTYYVRDGFEVRDGYAYRLPEDEEEDWFE